MTMPPKSQNATGGNHDAPSTLPITVGPPGVAQRITPEFVRQMEELGVSDSVLTILRADAEGRVVRRSWWRRLLHPDPKP